VIRRLLDATAPAEARFFLFVGGFGILLAAIDWFISYELAGTVLLGGFGVGAGLLGVRLRMERPVLAPEAALEHHEGADLPDVDAPGAGATPFRDESGRLPGESLAPLAVGLGVALALTAVVFGPWLLVAGIVPLAWGAWTWLSGANDELGATVRHETRPPVARAADGGDAAEARAADAAATQPPA
jgi:hypothetical protein